MLNYFQLSNKTILTKELHLRKRNFINAFRDKNKFWKEVKYFNGRPEIEINCIYGETDKEKIVDIFEGKYKDIFNCDNSKLVPDCYIFKMNELMSREILDNCKIDSLCVEQAFSKLNKGNGWDFVHSNHLKFGGNMLNFFLSRLFSCFISHSYLPVSLLHGKIKPIIKKRNGNRTDPDNYRPVMNSSNVLKGFEYCILSMLEKCIDIDSHQFGFRKNTGCVSAITVLKESVLRYNSEGSNVHCAMVDLSKAFDKINHKILITKLIDANVPTKLVLILKYMMENVFVNVLCGSIQGKKWQVNNGTRQGGILSPLLFNFYINEMVKTLSRSDIGCKIGCYATNIICYADDIILCAPSVSGLQFLIDKACSMLHDLCLPLNDKSKYIIFEHNKHSKIQCSIDVAGQVIENVTNCTYLGTNLSDDSSLNEDISRCATSFLNMFNAIFYKFSFLNVQILSFLVRSYCLSLYGAELWYDYSSIRLFNKFAVAYHKAVKRVAGMAPWHSNHKACDITGLPILRHIIHKKILSLYFSIVHSRSSCLLPLKNYFKYSSFLLKSVSSIFRDFYQVENIKENNECALKSRIDYVQAHEERSNYGV